jgi:hypothetical protein
MTKQTLQRAFRFFFDQAGYVVGQRAAGALYQMTTVA